jgi:HK97 family phage major capsid protein
VDQCSSNDYKALVSMGDGTTGWVSETGSRAGTNSPTLRERAPTFGEQYAYPTTTEWALDDVFFNVQKWLVDEVAADWASQEATAIISGDGSSKPTGILASSPAANNDDGSPLRAAGVIEYIPLSNPSSPFTSQIHIDSLIDLVGSVKERYLQETDGVAFVMHRLTAAHLRKLKSSSGGDYMWQESSQAGLPPMLLGYKVLTCDAMPTVGANEHPVLFGNFKRGYLLVDRVGIRVTPNPYSVPGKVSFYVRRRLGGCVLNNDAIKALKVSLT